MSEIIESMRVMKHQIDEVNNFVTDTIIQNINNYEDLLALQKIKAEKTKIVLEFLNLRNTVK